MRETAHIHVGPGALGLGLVVSSSCDAGMDVYPVVRVGTELPRQTRYELKVIHSRDDRPETQTRRVAEFWRASALADLTESALEVLADTPHLLLTTSVGTQAFASVRPFIVEMVTYRAMANHAQTTTFIAAENDPGSDYAEFRAELEQEGVRVCRTMVNRLCPSRRATEDGYSVTVDVEQEWVIELRHPPVPPPLVALASLAHVEVTPEATARETRKLWLINGSHLALALTARSTKNIELMHEAAAEPGRTKWILRLQHELAEVLRDQGLAVGDELEYGRRHFASVARNNDPVWRILRRFKRADLMPFLEDLDLKLGSAMRAQYASDGALSQPFREVLDYLQTLLTRFDSFEDAKRIRKQELWLSEDADELVLRRYGELLTGYIGAEMASFRESVAARAWARQRLRFERRQEERRKPPAEKRPPAKERRAFPERRRRAAHS